LYYNPQFSQYRFGAGKMSTLFKASAVAVILFSSVFVVYANKFFVKTRKKEIAIYSLLGMKKSQIGRMLFYENIFMGVLAIVCGVLLGTLFSRFFAMILSNLMSSRVKVGFSIRIEAVITTAVAFFILFVINSFNAYAIIYRYRLIELLSAGKEGEKTPRYSALGGIVSILMIAAGYVISQVMDVNKGGLKLLLPSFLILFLVVTGTILLFQNFIPMVLFKLKQNENFYFKPANYISLSQIVYRIRANSRILSVIAVLSAATITIAGSTYSMYTSFEASWKYYSPFSYMCFNADELQYKGMLDTIKKVHEVKVASTNRFQLIKVQGSCPGIPL
jgi:putative ABC transport system permease protein